MRGRDRLHSVEKTAHAPADELTNLTEGAFGSFVSSESQEPEISHAPPARGPDVADAWWSDESKTLFDSRFAYRGRRACPCPDHDELVEDRQSEQLVEAGRRLRCGEALA